MGILESLVGGGIQAVGSIWNNERNIGFQQEQNQITRDREDNAVQRRAKDMEAAGINPVMAAGSPASAAAMPAPRATENVGQAAVEGAHKAINIAQTQAAADLTRAQTEKVKEETKLYTEPFPAEDGKEYLYRHMLQGKLFNDANISYNKVMEGNRDIEIWNAAVRAGAIEAEAAQRRSLADYKDLVNRWMITNKEKLLKDEWYMSQTDVEKAELMLKMLKREEAWQGVKNVFQSIGQLTGAAASGYGMMQQGMLNRARRLAPSEY